MSDRVHVGPVIHATGYPRELRCDVGRRTEEAQGLVEYALIILLVATACVAGVTAFGTSVNGAINSIVGTF